MVLVINWGHTVCLTLVTSSNQPITRSSSSHLRAETTCVLLPAVQKFNASVNSAQQAELVALLWDDPIVAAVLKKYRLTPEKSDLGDVLDAIIRELGFPRTLKEYGVGRENLERIAESSIGDICSTWNAISLVNKEQVLEILEMCVGDEKE